MEGLNERLVTRHVCGGHLGTELFPEEAFEGSGVVWTHAFAHRITFGDDGEELE
jgi:hypothetical protein